MLAAILPAFAVSLVLGASSAAQSALPTAPVRSMTAGDPSGDARPGPRNQRMGGRRVVLRGIVLAPDGLPAEGALVTAMPGGEARTEVHGGFELVAQVPLRTVSLGLAIRSTGTPAGETSRRVLLPTVSNVVDLGTVLLDPSTPFQPRWVSTFGAEPGTDGGVREFVVFDDGSGPALYAGGFFRTAGGRPAHSVAKWDGQEWSPLGEGPGGDVQSLTVFDDGTGPALYAGLYLRSGFPNPEHWVMKWDGSIWKPLASDLDGPVEDLAAFDDGSGPCLYAAGRFLNAGGQPIRYLARWDGTGWSPVGAEPNSIVEVLEVIDLGSGPELYVGGFFTHMGGLEVNRIARWNGSWSAVGTGRNNTVITIAGYDDGTGTKLFVGGSFSGRVARWNGSFWSTVAGGFSSDVASLQGYDDGSGPALYASGLFISNPRALARWSGGGWVQVGAGMNSFAGDMVVFDDGTGPELVLGGFFTSAGDRSVHGVATWDGTRFAPLDEEATGLNGSVRALARFDLGQGPELYAGGFFRRFPDPQLTDGVARWDGAEWMPVGEDMRGPVHALLPHDDGSGEALFIGGSLFSGQGSIGNVVSWDGTSFSMLDGGVDFIVQALARFDAGSGPELYAAGGFLSNDAHISRWDGTQWSNVATFDDECHALLAFDAGGGSELYAAGDFTLVGGLSANRIASWNGLGWSGLDSGLNGAARALTVFDSGAGPRLVVGGEFTLAGGQPVAGLASWDGSAWAPLGGGVDGAVSSLAVLDDGRGPALYVGGAFDTAGGVAAQGIARWDGAGWEPLGEGVYQPEGFGLSSGVFALLPQHDLGHPELIVGGGFSSVPESGDSYLARWGGMTVCLDFETEDDFQTPLVNGQAIDGGEFGLLLGISGSGPNAGAALFDSTPGGPNDPSQDRDLLVGTGNVLILQTDASTSQSVPGIFDRPNDDEHGGVLTFDFVVAVRPVDLVLLDIDGGSVETTLVVQIDSAGRRRTHTVPPGWTGDLLDGAPGRLRLELAHIDPQPGYASTATATEDPGFVAGEVVSLEVWLGSSGAVDDICWE